MNTLLQIVVSSEATNVTPDDPVTFGGVAMLLMMLAIGFAVMLLCMGVVILLGKRIDQNAKKSLAGKKKIIYGEEVSVPPDTEKKD